MSEFDMMNTQSDRLAQTQSEKARPYSGTDSEAEFNRDTPNVQQQERVFNLSGQGKPISGLIGEFDSESKSMSGKAPGVPSENQEY